MLSDVVQDATAQEVTPFVRKGALGKWRALKGNTNRMPCRVKSGNIKVCRAGDQTI
jgi:hypothetical protein